MSTLDVGEKFTGSIVKDNGQKTSGTFTLVKNNQDILFFREEKSGQDIHIPFQAVSEIIKGGVNKPIVEITLDNAKNLEGNSWSETVPDVQENNNKIQKNTKFVNFLKHFDVTTNSDGVDVRPIFGEDFQYSEDESRSTTTSDIFQTKLSLSTNMLNGDYLVFWEATMDNKNTIFEVRLRNTTDSITVGTKLSDKPSNVSSMYKVSGKNLITFHAESKSFDVQWRAFNQGEVQGIRDVRIFLWRVL